MTQINVDRSSEDNVECLPLYAYEEEPPTVKTASELCAEERKILEQFEFAMSELPESDNTGVVACKIAYTTLSNNDHVHCLTQCITQELKKEHELLDLSFVGLGVGDALLISAALRYNLFVTTLNLTGNNLYADDLLNVVNAIRDGRNIVSVNFSSNRLGRSRLCSKNSFSVRGGDVIRELISSGSRIQFLQLRNNYLGDEDILIFAPVLADNTVLQSIDLGCNEIHYMGAVALSRMLSRNGDLRQINLEWNKFGTNGCTTLISEGILLNNTIKSINLSSCGLNDNAAQLLARVISENSIEVIHVADNHIGPVGADALAKAIKVSSSLVELILDGNPILDVGCMQILNILEESPPSTLHLVSMRHCKCSKRVEDYCCEKEWPNLTLRVSGSCCEELLEIEDKKIEK